MELLVFPVEVCAPSFLLFWGLLRDCGCSNGCQDLFDSHLNEGCDAILSPGLIEHLQVSSLNYLQFQMVGHNPAVCKYENQYCNSQGQINLIPPSNTLSFLR
ncbi:hypothetical protein CMV_020933 [Castanea mollissima]|uniref:Uncharacterized protein n=1 Tax=Castanea mollissima TaxID=60419 RepID=A0A8J4QVS0_9ROSI|nr:hypothetical protein CMV_020933 [Castanea mollissima]